MTYSEKVPVMVGSMIIDRVMGMTTKGELVRATMTWKQAHFGAVMSGSLQLPNKGTRGDRGAVKRLFPLQPLTLLHPRISTWMIARASLHHRVGQHSSIWIHQYSWQHRCLRALHVGSHACQACTRPQLPTSIVLTATYGELHTGSSQVPICLRNLSACSVVIPAKVVIGKVTPANQVLPVALPMGTSGEPTCGSQKD